jgi:hypothetical protein
MYNEQLSSSSLTHIYSYTAVFLFQRKIEQCIASQNYQVEIIEIKIKTLTHPPQMDHGDVQL